ncbi:MAG: flagellar basal-body rod protein FlgF [Bdellovibrionales bacterium]
MSSKGIFTALSGAMAQSQRLDTIANNIANANTTSFKKDQQTFYEYLSAAEKTPDVIQVPRVPASTESFYDMQGGDRGYVDSAGTFTDFTQGQLRPTGSTLDVALEGRGLLEVLSPQGVRLTRNGQLKIDSNGTLVTKEGFPVLRDGSQDPAQRRIQVEGRNLTISQNGEIYDNGNQLARLSVVEVANPDSLQKVGTSMYALKPNFNETLTPSNETQVRQGFIELSNVNIVDEMTDMISASRAFETAQRAMKAFDQMDDKLVNEVAKT